MQPEEELHGRIEYSDRKETEKELVILKTAHMSNEHPWPRTFIFLFHQLKKYMPRNMIKKLKEWF